MVSCQHPDHDPEYNEPADYTCDCCDAKICSECRVAAGEDLVFCRDKCISE